MNTAWSIKLQIGQSKKAWGVGGVGGEGVVLLGVRKGAVCILQGLYNCSPIVPYFTSFHLTAPLWVVLLLCPFVSERLAQDPYNWRDTKGCSNAGAAAPDSWQWLAYSTLSLLEAPNACLSHCLITRLSMGHKFHRSTDLPCQFLGVQGCGWPTTTGNSALTVSAVSFCCLTYFTILNVSFCWDI